MINETVYSGYLDTDISSRKIHYVFIAARNQPDTAPLTIWFNGGPGCSSMDGFIYEQGPFEISHDGTSLTLRPYRWYELFLR